MFHSGEVDVAWRLATRALNLQPGKSAVDGLVDRRRGVDRLSVGPHPFVPALANQPVRLLDECFALGPHLGRPGGQYAGHRTRLAELLLKRLSVISGEQHRVVLRRHPDIQDFDNAHALQATIQTKASSRLPRAGQYVAGTYYPTIAGQDSSRPSGGGQPDGIRLLYLDDAGAAPARDAEHVPLNVAELLHLDQIARRSRVGASVVQDGVPVFRRHLVGRTRRGFSRHASRDGGGHLFHLFGLRHAPACGSMVMPE